MNGPSPRVRGELADDGPTGPGQRAIPACAGRTSLAGRGCAVSPGHPRVCGENGDVFIGVVPVGRAIPACAGRTANLSPLTFVPSRAIPACAGRTRLASISRSLWSGPSPRVRGELIHSSTRKTAASGHPRVCGENSNSRWLATLDSGPSPRVRGERGALAAGKLARPGHPRVCGENPNRTSGVAAPLRAIPACAGRTSR